MSETRPHGRAVLGTLTLGLLLAACLVVFSGTLERLTAKDGEHITVSFDTSARLTKGDPVRARGVTVGRVEKITAGVDGRSTDVELVVDEELLPLYRDASAAIKWRTLLGGSYQVVVDRGSPARGTTGERVIPRSRTSSQVELDEVLTALRDRERDGLQTMLSELPDALRRDDAPRRALDAVADEAPAVDEGLAALRGEDGRALRRLVDNSAWAVRALDAPGPDLGDVVGGGAATLSTTARRADDIEKTLVRTAATLPQIRTTVDRLRATLHLADPVLDDLRDAAPDLATSVARLRPVVRDADGLLHDARPLVDGLRPAAGALSRAARAGRPVLDGLEPILQRLDERVLPDLAKPDPVTKRPTYQMIGLTLSAAGAAAAGYDQVSHMLSLTAGGGERILDTLPCHTYFGNAASAEKVVCQELGPYFAALLGVAPPAKGRGR